MSRKDRHKENLVEIIGPLKDEDTVLRRGSDEICQDTDITVRIVPATNGVKQ